MEYINEITKQLEAANESVYEETGEYLVQLRWKVHENHIEVWVHAKEDERSFDHHTLVEVNMKDENGEDIVMVRMHGPLVPDDEDSWLLPLYGPVIMAVLYACAC
jgi:hypothetical protein